MSRKVKTIEPVKEKRRFNSVEEFNKFVNEHQEEFDKSTTCILNKKYEVPGYRITRIQGELSLKNIPESRQTALDKIEHHNNRLATIESTLNTLIGRFNEVVTKVNEALKEVQAMKTAQQEQSVIIDHLSEEIKKTTYVPPPEPPKPEPVPKNKSRNKPDEDKDQPTLRSTGRLNPIAAKWMGLG